MIGNAHCNWQWEASRSNKQKSKQGLSREIRAISGYVKIPTLMFQISIVCQTVKTPNNSKEFFMNKIKARLEKLSPTLKDNQQILYSITIIQLFAENSNKKSTNFGFPIIDKQQCNILPNCCL